MNNTQLPPTLDSLLHVIETAEHAGRIITPGAPGRVCEDRHAFIVSSIGADSVRRCCDSRDCRYKIVEQNGQYCVLREAFAEQMRERTPIYAVVQ